MNNSARSTVNNPHDLNIEDSKLVNMINSSRQFKNDSNLSQNDATINPHERNIEVYTILNIGVLSSTISTHSFLNLGKYKY